MKLPPIQLPTPPHAPRDSACSPAQSSSGQLPEPKVIDAWAPSRAARSLAAVQRAQQGFMVEMLSEATICATYLQQPSAQWLGPQLLDTLQQEMACLQEEGSTMLLTSAEHLTASEQACELAEPRAVEACLAVGRDFVQAYDSRLEILHLALTQLHHVLAHGHEQSGPEAPPVLPSYASLPVARLSPQQRAEGFCPIVQLPLHELQHPVAMMVDQVWHIFEHHALENYLQTQWPHATGPKVYRNPLTRQMVPLHDLYRLKSTSCPRGEAEDS